MHFTATRIFMASSVLLFVVAPAANAFHPALNFPQEGDWVQAIVRQGNYVLHMEYELHFESLQDFLHVTELGETQLCISLHHFSDEFPNTHGMQSVACDTYKLLQRHCFAVHFSDAEHPWNSPKMEPHMPHKLETGSSLDISPVVIFLDKIQQPQTKYRYIPICTQLRVTESTTETIIGTPSNSLFTIVVRPSNANPLARNLSHLLIRSCNVLSRNLIGTDTQDAVRSLDRDSALKLIELLRDEVGCGLSCDAPWMSVNSAMSNRPEKLGINWAVGGHFGWGIFGKHLFCSLVKSNTWEPVPLAGGNAAIGFEEQCLEEFKVKATKMITGMEKVSLGNNYDEISRSTILLDFPILHQGDHLLGTTPSSFGMGSTTFGSSKFPLHWSLKHNSVIVFFDNETLLAGQTQSLTNRGMFYNHVFVGSSWNKERLEPVLGTTPCSVIYQGIDRGVFTPFNRGTPAVQKREPFVIFSGGKLEFRKGQDIVIESFRRFRERNPAIETKLLLAWHNEWPQTTRLLERSPYTTGLPNIQCDDTEKCTIDVSTWLLQNGLEDTDFKLLGRMNHSEFATQVISASVALFPNRCEGGTSLVAMEVIACGIPTILSANTGHLDLLRTPGLSKHVWQLVNQSVVPGTEFWGESSVVEIVSHLEEVYSRYFEASQHGRDASQIMHEQWSWDKVIDDFLETYGVEVN